MTNAISYSVENSVARLVLDNPEGRNVIGQQFVTEFAEYAGQCAQDDTVKVIVISARGDYFSVGGDLAEFLKHTSDIESYIRGLAETFHRGIAALQGTAIPIVVSVN